MIGRRRRTVRQVSTEYHQSLSLISVHIPLYVVACSSWQCLTFTAMIAKLWWIDGGYDLVVPMTHRYLASDESREEYTLCKQRPIKILSEAIF